MVFGSGKLPIPRLGDPFALSPPQPISLLGHRNRDWESSHSGADAIAFSDGIAVIDEGHPDDIPARVKLVLINVAGTEAETIRRELATTLESVHKQTPDCRNYFKCEFFADHINRYQKARRRAPIYWQLSTPNSGYSVVLYYHRLTKDTLYQCATEYLRPKVAFEDEKLARLRNEAGAEPNISQRGEIEEQEAFVGELKAFSEGVERVAPLWNPSLNDGVLINAAPLWRLLPQHKAWQKDVKGCWDKLVEGEYDWSQLAMHLWPERVVPKCAEDVSLAIAHGLDDILWDDNKPEVEETEQTASVDVEDQTEMYEGDDEEAKPKRKPSRTKGTLRWTLKPTVNKKLIDQLIAERTNPTVKAALKNLLEATTPSGKTSRKSAASKSSKRGKKAEAEGLF